MSWLVDKVITTNSIQLLDNGLNKLIQVEMNKYKIIILFLKEIN